ncbi:hypothetical protein [Pandoraea sputorum]|uniref:hypothetical protein n=1 Tax=Pandoraea sputorum TaxID=93222 RepID=UPI001240571F|nr:hypothetical protein [Pandoraea sputorum]VVE77379.1 hypothetical protein PSP31120_01262 [Pandoraea sputorum]
MTISSQYSYVSATANGVTTVFPFAGLKVNSEDDLVVTLKQLDDTVITYALGADYTVTGVKNNSGGAVNFVTAPPAGELLINRLVDVTQTTNLRNQGRYYPEVVENALDTLEMQIQQLSRIVSPKDQNLSRALLLGYADTIGSGAYQALGNRISYMADGIDDADAVTLRQVNALIERLITDGAGQIVLDLLAAADGATLVGYGTGTVASTLDQILANPVGIQFLNNYAALDAYTGTQTELLLLGGFVQDDGNGGFWCVDTTLLASQANIGTIRVDASNRVWRRKVDRRELNPYWFKGASGDTDFTILQRSFNASITLALAGTRWDVVPPPGSLFVGTTTLTIPSFLCFRGSGYRGFVINYNGTGTLFQCATGMEHATIGGFRIGLGSSATVKAFDLTTASGTTIRKNKFHDIEIAGAAVAGQIGINQTATVVSTITNIISENEFTNIVFVQVDKPVQDAGSEGNYWRGFVVDGFGYTPGGSVAFNMTSHANFYQGRIAGAPTAGSTAVTQGGNRNEFHLVVDIGASSKALDISGVGNGGFVSLPEGLTPAGNIAANNQIKTSEIDYSPGAIKGRYTIAANGTITTQGGIAATCVRNAAGNYTLTMSRVFVNCRASVQVVGIGGAAFAIVSSITTASGTTSINFVTINTSGSGADPASSVFVEVTADN